MRRSYTYGVLPPFADFREAFDVDCHGSFDWRLQGSDADAMLAIGFYARQEWTDSEAFYSDVERMIACDDERVLDVVSSIMAVMGFEWV